VDIKWITIWALKIKVGPSLNYIKSEPRNWDVLVVYLRSNL